jgi:hypothetical protein
MVIATRRTEIRREALDTERPSMFWLCYLAGREIPDQRRRGALTP